MRNLFVLAVTAFLATTISSQAFWKFGSKKDKTEEVKTTAVAVMDGMTPISSSLLKAASYNEAAKVLTLQFVKGDVYNYEGVSKELFDGLMSADSKGKFFRKNIRDQFKTVKQ